MSMSREAPRAPLGTHIPPPRVYARPRVPQTSRHGQLTSGKRARTYQLLRHGLVFKEVSRLAGVGKNTPYWIHNNIMTYGAMLPPRMRVLGRPQKLTAADREALYNELLEYGWMNQAEMMWWLEQERGVVVSQSTVSRFLRSERINRKVMRLTSLNRDEDLRDDYRRIISQYTAGELVFIDESIFKEKDGWRCRAYGPMGSQERWRGDARRGKTFSILPAYTLSHGYLDCTAIREGYFNTEALLEWIEESLLPTLDRKFGRPMCIVLDNCSTHCDAGVADAVRSAGHTLQYLPPYSPDFNPIELTFSVLKAWLKRYFYYIRNWFDDFEDLLRYAVSESACDRFSREHFRHAGGGGLYIEDAALESLRGRILLFERGEIDLL